MDINLEANSQIDRVLAKYGETLKPVARVMLLATFIDDGFRMLLQFNDQATYVRNSWNCGGFIAYSLIIINLVLQLGPAAMILMRQKVNIAVGCLFGVVILQMIMYQVLWDFRFLVRSVSVTGGLLFLLAEGSSEAKRVFALLPGMETKEERQSNVLQLAGRVLIGMMFVPLIKFDSWLRIFLELIAVALLIMVYIGFETKLAATALVFLLAVENMILNNFWSYRVGSHTFDFKIYDFFQTVSVMGGLLMITILGPGGFSLDQRKKSM